MNISEKAERTAQPPILRHFQNQETDYSSEVPDTAGKKTIKRRTHNSKVLWQCTLTVGKYLSLSIALKHTTLISTESYSLEIVLV